MTRVTISGIDDTLKGIKDDRQFKRWATPMMQDIADAALPVIRKYAPERVGSRYQRTGTLRNSMQKEVTGNGRLIVARVFSAGAIGPRDNRYEQWVKHPSLQAWMHRGHWPTTNDDAATLEPKVSAIVRRHTRKQFS